MGTFIYQSNSSLTICTYRRCGLVTQGGATIFDSTFDSATGTYALNVANAVANVTDSLFISSGTGYGLEGFTTAASYDLNGLTFLDYAASDGVTGNEMIHVLATSGTVTLNITGGTIPSIHTEGAIVVIVSGAVTIAGKAVTKAGVGIQNARVLLKASDGTGPFPFDETVTIVNSGTTATVAHTAHGIATNDYVQITQGNLAANRGVFQITVTGVDEYTYTMNSTPGASPTGTIKSTFVALYGLTDVNGDLSISRVYSADQPVSGWTRKSTSSPYYQEGALVGTVTSSGGFNGTAVMVDDE